MHRWPNSPALAKPAAPLGKRISGRIVAEPSYTPVVRRHWVTGWVCALASVGALAACARGGPGEVGYSDDEDDGSGGGFSSMTTGAGGTTTTSTSAQTVGSGPVGSGPSSTGVTTGGGTCDNTFDCQTCQVCADAGPCLYELDACLYDYDCLDFASCIETCVDQACYDSCGSYYPYGESLYLDYASCVICSACYNDCDGASACI